LRDLFGWSDRTVDVPRLVEAGPQILVGGEDGGPAVEADHGGQQVDHGGHAPVDQLDVEQGHHHHDPHRAGQDDVQHAQDQEGDHQTPDLTADTNDEEETEDGSDTSVESTDEDDGWQP